MKHLTEYTMNNLYGLFEPYGKYKLEEICYIVSKSLEDVVYSSLTTDKLDHAVIIAKQYNYKIFIYEKKFSKDCLDTHLLFRNMLDNIKEEGFDTYCIPNDIKKDGEKEFSELIENWFDKYIGNTYWFADRFLGELKLDEKQEKEDNK